MIACLDILNNAALWTAIGSIATGAMAVATYITLRQNDSQRKELLRQNFESTLFFLIKEFREARNRVSYNNEASGSDALSQAWEQFKMSIAIQNYNATSMDDKPFRTSEQQSSKPLVSANYLLVTCNNLCDLSGYYHSLITALDFIDRSDYNEDTKRMYVAFVENNLTEKDLLWLFYTCVCDGRKQELLRLVEKWQLLRNLPPEKLIQPTHKTWLAPSAFGDK